MPESTVVLGTGGVGKTTVSAGLALALARDRRTLVVTLDPARRLADVLGVAASPEVVPVPGAPGLACYMPDVANGTDRLVTDLLADATEHLEVLRDNPIYRALRSGLAGMHELVSVARLCEEQTEFDAVVVDTAPTRHALDVLALPARLDEFVGGRALRWLGALSSNRLAERKGIGRVLGWGQRRFVRGFETALGAGVVASTMEVLTAALAASPKVAAMAKTARDLLTGPDTDYAVVLAPRPGAAREARFFATSLPRAPSLFVVNRATVELPQWPSRLASHPDAPEPLRRAATTAHAELAAAERDTRAVLDALARAYPRADRVAVPVLEDGTPGTIARDAARVLAHRGRPGHPTRDSKLASRELQRCLA